MIEEFKEQMTPKERMQALAAGRPFDRIPCNPSISDHAAKLVGIKVSDYHRSAKQMARAQIAAYRRYGHDGISASASIAEALGSKMSFPDNSTPYFAENVVREISDLDKLEPPDPRRDGRLPMALEALEIMMNEVGTEVPVSWGHSGPLSTASALRGIDNLMRDIYKNPDFTHRLLQLAVDSIIPFVEEAGKLGVGFAIMDPVASGSLISQKIFREFALPYLKKLIQAMHRASGKAPMLHICGNTTKIWHDMADTGAGVLSLDNIIDLAEAKKAVGERVILAGNIRPTNTMFLGGPKDVVENVRECLSKAYDTPKGYVLAMGCGLPTDTPVENVEALMHAARKYGRYPLNPQNFS